MPNVRVIDSTPPTLAEYCREAFRFKQLFRFFLWRDIIVRYKQALLGVSWVVLKPLLTTILFTFIFGMLARFPSDEVSYPLFVLAGMLPWQMIANSMNDACSSLTANNQLIVKAYFPRVLLPLSQITAQATDFAVNTVVLIFLCMILGSFPSLLTLITLPLLGIWTLVLACGIGLWLSSLTARYRDIRFLVTFAVQFGLFLSPVGYATSLVPEKYQMFYCLNPLVGLIDSFRLCLFGITHPNIDYSIPISLAMTALLAMTGLLYFKKTEPSLVDLL